MSDQGQQTYQRAIVGALLGLGVQTLSALVLLAVAFSGDPAAMLPAVWYAFAGIPVWLVLVLLYHQHRLEREEALESERLARQAPESRLFGEAGDALSLSRRRLQKMYGLVLPLTGVLVGAYLMAGGLWRLGEAQASLAPHPESVHGLERPLVGMAFCLGVAFVDFLVGRYVAGMTRVKEWELLRGAAGFLMGTALVSTVLCGVLGAVNFDAYAPLHYLPHALCAVEILLGAEVLLNLVLNFYRPRKTGETPRPAFDSRVLGLLTSPESLGKALQEALNYQFGFEVTRSWFWRLLNRWAAPLFAVGVLSLFAVSCLVLVEPQQQALVLRFGALSRPEPLGPGLHFKWPWPVETASAWDVQRVRQFALGSHEHLKEGETVLWTNEHGDSEQLLMAAPPPSLAETGGAGAGQRAPSISLMAAEVYVNYRIRDLVAFARGESEPEALLKDLAERELTRNLLAEDVDVWLGARHVELGQRLRERIQAEADRRKLGVEVLFVGTAGLHPPRDVAEAFHTVVRGYQEAATARERALKDEIAKLARAAGTPDHARRILEQIERYDYLKANNAEPKVLARQEAQIEELLQQAGGEAARLIAEARAFRHESENAERAKAERFTQELQAYRRAPELYRARRYLEVLAEGLKNRRKIVVVSGRKDLTVRIDLKDEGRELAPIDLESVLPKESPKP